jgi:hypothetical protein
VKSILCEHARRYPLWELPDVYKLLQQAALGAEHALTSETAARDWLTQELAHLDAGPDEALIDPISPNGDMVRVHLRPFAMLQLSSGELLKAFIQTALEAPRSMNALQRSIRAAIELARGGNLPCSEDEAKRYFDERRLSGYPPAHHSEQFRRAYKPAYRVISRKFLPRALEHL